eukprot:gene4717-4810_t
MDSRQVFVGFALHPRRHIQVVCGEYASLEGVVTTTDVDATAV